MPWTKKDYPVSMKNLPAGVRNKAIDIANALLEDRAGMDEGLAIAIAISRARDWAANRGKNFKSRSRRSKSTDVKRHGADRYVIPYAETEWALKKEGSKRPEKVFRDKASAVRAAREKAKRDRAGVTVQSRSGKVQKRISYNPRRKAVKLK